ncbi:L-idonate 5-dehydrogenase [Roseibium algae]|uniref:L-idonate 5-dehydrogenase n=1 Tax=Roseibium algae TaxID=3123038 RepID=A0ABU8TJC3_9HYPH
MQAIVIHAAKDLRVEEREAGTPGPGEVLVSLAAGGICGSDLHYYNHGGFGVVRLKEPMVLGHEVSGKISALGEGVSGLALGDLVAVSPSRPCGGCSYCQKGQHNHCENMRFYGSAMPFPHIQGAFQQSLVAQAVQCVKADGLSAGEAAMAEPLSVCLHATRRAGEILGKKVLITGSGPIGALCVLAARSAGAAEIVVTDLSDSVLAYATQVGADRVINTASEPEALSAYAVGKGYFDVHYECSGAAPALAGAIPTLKPRAVILQLGLGGDMSLPVQAMTAKELDWRGSFRFHEEFAIAVRLMQLGQIDVKPLISHTMGFADAVKAFDLAGDRSQAMKVQLAFG